jgi:tetratricopeptide (TPR) repeat protein
MSFFKNLFGGTFEGNRSEGDSFFAEGRLGEAKLAYERALARGKDAPRGDVEIVQARVKECRSKLARAKIAEADALAQDGDLELAGACLAEVREILDTTELKAEVEDRQKKLEAMRARSLLGEVAELTEDELIAVLAGAWTEDQADEYAAMPEPFREALLAAHDGDHTRAAALIRGVLDAPDLELEPRYAWYELGQELAAAGEHDKAVESLDRFLGAFEDGGEEEEDGGEEEEDGGEGEEDEEPGLEKDMEIKARTLKARALVALERDDEARQEILETTRLAPEDYSVYLNYGVFLRGRKEYEKSVVALERAIELMGQLRPDFHVVKELGFTYMAMGLKQEAMRTLSSVLEHQASQGAHDQFDPEAGVVLAKLHEEAGAFNDAADIHRHLATGYDTARHFLYNLESARLLGLAGAEAALVDRYLARAAELASDDEQRAMALALRALKRG